MEAHNHNSPHKSSSLKKMAQLDGLRAFCLVSIVIHHWTIHHLELNVPFEVGAFLFFGLSGYLITRILLREQSKITSGATTHWSSLKRFIQRRAVRLIPGYCVALLLYVLILEPEVLNNFVWYLTNSCNIHFARLGYFPGGADQFWTLAVDQQFYIVWPLVILFCPRPALPYVLIVLAALSPLSRLFAHYQLLGFDRPMMDKLPWFLTDHLCLGSFLAVLHEKNRLPSRRSLWLLLITTLVIYGIMRYDLLPAWDQHPILVFQQTLLAISSVCLVGLSATGFSGIAGRVLEHHVIQYIGQRSYGYYLYHNLAMLLLGKIMWFLWYPVNGFDALYSLRLIFGLFLLWAMGHYSWKYIEEPLTRLKR